MSGAKHRAWLTSKTTPQDPGPMRQTVKLPPSHPPQIERIDTMRERSACAPVQCCDYRQLTIVRNLFAPTDQTRSRCKQHRLARTSRQAVLPAGNRTGRTPTSRPVLGPAPSLPPLPSSVCQGALRVCSISRGVLEPRSAKLHSQVRCNALRSPWCRATKDEGFGKRGIGRL